MKANASDLEGLYSGEMGQRFQTLVFRETQPGTIQDEEKKISIEILQELQMIRQPDDLKRPGALRVLIAGMLVLPRFELAGRIWLEILPNWLRQDTLRYLLGDVVFREVGDVERYAEALALTVARLHEGLRQDTSSRCWRELAHTFLQYARMFSLYFSQRNLLDTLVQRADVASFALSQIGFRLDHSPGDRRDSNRIRVGFLAEGYTAHTETFANMPLFEKLNQDDFEIYLYALRSNENAIENRCREVASVFRTLKGEIEEQVECIRRDNLDVMVFGQNVCSNTNSSFVTAAHRVARKQVTHFTCPLSTGLRQMDHFLIGSLAEGGGAQSRYSERLVTLPGSGICFSVPDDFTKDVSLNLPLMEAKFNFISGANYFKITPELQRAWAGLLQSVPDSNLIIYPFGPAWSDDYPKSEFIVGFRRVLTESGVDNSAHQKPNRFTWSIETGSEKERVETIKEGPVGQVVADVETRKSPEASNDFKPETEDDEPSKNELVIKIGDTTQLEKENVFASSKIDSSEKENDKIEKPQGESNEIVVGSESNEADHKPTDIEGPIRESGSFGGSAENQNESPSDLGYSSHETEVGQLSDGLAVAYASGIVHAELGVDDMVNAPKSQVSTGAEKIVPANQESGSADESENLGDEKLDDVFSNYETLKIVDNKEHDKKADEMLDKFIDFF